MTWIARARDLQAMRSLSAIWLVALALLAMLDALPAPHGILIRHLPSYVMAIVQSARGLGFQWILASIIAAVVGPVLGGLLASRRAVIQTSARKLTEVLGAFPLFLMLYLLLSARGFAAALDKNSAPLTPPGGDANALIAFVAGLAQALPLSGQLHQRSVSLTQTSSTHPASPTIPGKLGHHSAGTNWHGLLPTRAQLQSIRQGLAAASFLTLPTLVLMDAALYLMMPQDSHLVLSFGLLIHQSSISWEGYLALGALMFSSIALWVWFAPRNTP